MPDDKERDENMDALSRAIVEAILKSEDVKDALGKIAGKEDFRDRSFMVLMLKIQNLTKTMGLEVSSLSELADEGLAMEEETGNRKPELDILEDGTELSSQEKAFREFLADRFDQDEWLKKHGLIL